MQALTGSGRLSAPAGKAAGAGAGTRGGCHAARTSLSKRGGTTKRMGGRQMRRSMHNGGQARGPDAECAVPWACCRLTHLFSHGGSLGLFHPHMPPAQCTMHGHMAARGGGTVVGGQGGRGSPRGTVTSRVGPGSGCTKQCAGWRLDLASRSRLLLQVRVWQMQPAAGAWPVPALLHGFTHILTRTRASRVPPAHPPTHRPALPASSW